MFLLILFLFIFSAVFCRVQGASAGHILLDFSPDFLMLFYMVFLNINLHLLIVNIYI